MTNYEKIKSMSFKKMVKFLYYFEMPCEMCPHDDDCSGSCRKALKDWLKSESEED